MYHHIFMVPLQNTWQQYAPFMNGVCFSNKNLSSINKIITVSRIMQCFVVIAFKYLMTTLH